ncbi:MAG: peroxiredoxin [Myxococcota bacterium]
MVSRYVDALGLSFPILLDEDGSINQAYAQQMAFPTAAYPQDWVIGTDGVVVYANNRFELTELVTAIERELP